MADESTNTTPDDARDLSYRAGYLAGRRDAQPADGSRLADDHRVHAARVIFAEVRERKGIYAHADARAVGLETMLAMVLEAVDEQEANR